MEPECSAYGVGAEVEESDVEIRGGVVIVVLVGVQGGARAGGGGTAAAGNRARVEVVGTIVVIDIGLEDIPLVVASRHPCKEGSVGTPAKVISIIR